MTDIASLGFKIDARPVSETNQLLKELVATSKKVETSVKTLADASTRSFNQAEKSAAALDKRMDSLTRTSNLLRRGLQLLGGAWAVTEVIKTADTYNLLEGRLKLVTKSTENLAAIEDNLYQASKRTRSSYEQTVQLYTRITQSVGYLGKTSEETARVVETVQKAIQLGGASAGEAAAAMLQLGQALGSNKLGGDELRSIMENTIGLSTALAKGLGVDIGQLKIMGAEGKLNAKAVYEALSKVSELVSKDFLNVPLTVGQSMQVLENAFLKFIGTANQAGSVTSILAGKILQLADYLDRNPQLAQEFGRSLANALDIAGAAMKFLYENAGLVEAIFAGWLAGNIVVWVIELGKALRVAAAAALLFDAALLVNPLFWIPAAIALIAALAVAIYNNWDKIKEYTKETANSMYKAWDEFTLNVEILVLTLKRKVLEYFEAMAVGGGAVLNKLHLISDETFQSMVDQAAANKTDFEQQVNDLRKAHEEAAAAMKKAGDEKMGKAFDEAITKAKVLEEINKRILNMNMSGVTQPKFKIPGMGNPLGEPKGEEVRTDYDRAAANLQKEIDAKRILTREEFRAQELAKAGIGLMDRQSGAVIKLIDQYYDLTYGKRIASEANKAERDEIEKNTTAYLKYLATLTKSRDEALALTDATYGSERAQYQEAAVVEAKARALEDYIKKKRELKTLTDAEKNQVYTTAGEAYDAIDNLKKKQEAIRDFKKYVEDSYDPLTKYNLAVKKLDDQVKALGHTMSADEQRAYNSKIVELQQNFIKAAEATNPLIKALMEVGDKIQSNLSDVFYNVMNGTKAKFSDFTKSLKEQFFRMLADMAAAAWTKGIIIPIVAQVGNMLGGGALQNSILTQAGLAATSNTGTGFLGSLFSSIGGLFGSAKGNVFQNGSMVHFDKGGIVDRMSAFMMANGNMGTMSEGDRAEAIMPLARGPDGSLGVVNHGGGGSTVVNNINVSVGAGASQGSVQDAQLAESISRKVDVIVQKQMANFLHQQMRIGGMLNKGVIAS